MSAIVATGLGKRYGKRWALQDCCLDVPEGRIVALVGPNGAGKTTLLHLAAGLLGPTAGSINVLGRNPWLDASVVRSIGFLAQDVPLFPSFTVAETLEFGTRMNPAWDSAFATGYIRTKGIPFEQRVRELSGGQRAQLGLVLALGKRPGLLLLDEPLAHLDPLARQEFLSLLMEGTVDAGVTVVMSSHLIVDLERACDYLIVLAGARTQVAGKVDDLLDEHRLLSSRRRDAGQIAGVASVVRRSDTDRQSTLFVRTNGPLHDRGWDVEEVTLEDLVIAYLGSPGSAALPVPRLSSMHEGGAS